MSAPDGIELSIRRRMLRVAVRNSARSVPLLVLVVLFFAVLAWESGLRWLAGTLLGIGLPVSAWRLMLAQRHGQQEAASAQQIDGVVRQLEGNALLVGVMWALATVFLAVHQTEWINGNGGLEWAASRCDRSADRASRCRPSASALSVVMPNRMRAE